MKHPAKRPHSRIGQSVDWLIEDVTPVTYVVSFLFFVLICAFAYLLLTPYGNGLGSGGKSLDAISLADAIYFSIVTVTSLGYGDLYPVGGSRVIACCEVLVGLAFMGITIAKVTSRRISYHVGRLFEFETQRRLEAFSEEFQTLAIVLGATLREMSAVYTPTPMAPAPPDGRPVLLKFWAQLEKLDAVGDAWSSYIALEANDAHFFENASPASLHQIGKQCWQTVFVLTQVIAVLTPEARVEVFQQKVFGHLNNSVKAIRESAEVISTRCANPEVTKCYLETLQSCGYLLLSLQQPYGIEPANPPDQRVTGAPA